MNEQIEQFATECYQAPEFDYKKFAELIVRDYANQLVQANMSNPAYAQAMDEYYENKWAHRFD